MNKRKFLRKLLASTNNARFDEVRGSVEAFGFRLVRVSGSRHIEGQALSIRRRAVDDPTRCHDADRFRIESRRGYGRGVAGARGLSPTQGGGA